MSYPLSHSPNELPDAEVGEGVVARVRAGDVQAFEALFHAHYAHLVDVACRLVGSEDQAEEIVQVALARMGCSSAARTPKCVANASQGDVAFVDNTGVSVTHLGEVGEYMAWMQGRLVFNETPLRDVVRDLERSFGVQITVTDSATIRQHVTGNFDNVPVDQVLDEITRMVGAQFEHHGRVVVIGQKAAAPARREGMFPAPLSTALKTETRP